MLRGSERRGERRGEGGAAAVAEAQALEPGEVRALKGVFVALDRIGRDAVDASELQGVHGGDGGGMLRRGAWAQGGEEGEATVSRSELEAWGAQLKGEQGAEGLQATVAYLMQAHAPLL